MKSIPTNQISIPVRDYDLAATLNSGQAFRWTVREGVWEGVIGQRWVRLAGNDTSIHAETTEEVNDWNWLTEYLQTGLELAPVLTTFPEDAPMQAAINACRGLRLLRQDAWECLASFILSSTKQIVQIRQIVALLCERFGEPISAGSSESLVHTFPTPDRLAGATEAELRACKMGFRAPYLLATSRLIADGKIDLERLHPSKLKPRRRRGDETLSCLQLSAINYQSKSEPPCVVACEMDEEPRPAFELESARKTLMQLPGVGCKIADCVLLFAYGYPTAFPVDVWVMKALRELYFPRRRASARRLLDFSASYFGPHAGYAQQYLFHYMRTRANRTLNR